MKTLTVEYTEVELLQLAVCWANLSSCLQSRSDETYPNTVPLMHLHRKLYNVLEQSLKDGEATL